MSLAPSPSTRGEITLQPAYFSSSAFVRPARVDVDELLHEYSQQYTRSLTRPFALFKTIWQQKGWPWMHFKVLDTRSRATFLRVLMRLFSERLGARETPLIRAAALFGLYTLFGTQPSTSTPPLSCAAHIEVTWDLYEETIALHDVLEGPIRAYVVYVQSRLLQAQAFQILPHSELHPQNPRVLPREVVVRDDEVTEEGLKRKGRPSRREKSKKARESLVALERRCGDDGAVSPPSATRERYESERTAVLGAANAGSVRDAMTRVGERVEWFEYI